MRQLSIIVIGLGHQSLEDHLPAIKESGLINLVGVVDVDRGIAEQIAKEYKVPHAISVKKLFNTLDVKPDAALIAVPHKDYLAIIKELANKGIDIIKEKPFAATIEEAKTMIKLAKDNNISLQVTLQRRFNPIFISFNQLIKRIGKIYSIEARYTLNIARLDSGWRAPTGTHRCNRSCTMLATPTPK